MSYKVTKNYPNSLGLSACFRQWRATESHCSYLHGYSLGVSFTFECETLDERNWCLDFGSLKQVKKFLEETFDHKTVVAQDDPELETFKDLANRGIIQLVVIPNVGCEKFAEFIFHKTISILELENNPRVKLISVTVSEHETNSATFTL